MSRRANGEGSFYRRKDGRWVGAFYVSNPEGGRVRPPVYGRTQAEAAAKLAEMVAKTGAGVPLAVKTWTVQAYGEHWLAHIVEPRPARSAMYRHTMRVHSWPGLGRYSLRRLTPALVRRLLADKAAAGLSVRLVQIIHATDAPRDAR